MMRDIMEVPLPRACSRRLMSFFTFHISMFFSASLACWALIVSEGVEYRHSGRICHLAMLCYAMLCYAMLSSLGAMWYSRIVGVNLNFQVGFFPGIYE